MSGAELMEKGLAVQFGEGLWLDHQKGHVIGDCMLREVVDGGRYCFEMGNLKAGQERLNGLQMSIGYNYRLKAASDYEFVYVFERSALEKPTTTRCSSGPDRLVASRSIRCSAPDRPVV